MWFTKRRKTEGQVPTSDIVAKGIANFICKMQTKWTNWMDDHYNSLTPNKRRNVFYSLVLLLLVSTIAYFPLSIRYLRESFFLSRASIVRIPQREQKVADHYDVPKKKMVDEVNTYQYYTDSLGNTPKGNLTLDSLYQCYPGLKDSIKQLLKYYRIMENN